MSIDQKLAAAALSALGHEVRLQIYRLLVRAGEDGMSVGDIGAHLDMPASTLAHHLSALVHAGLVVQERQGRTIFSRVDYGRMNALVGFLSDECCAGVDVKAREETV